MITIDVYHDTVCPWCRIGKRHLQQALEAWTETPVSVRYRTYFLNENIPSEGADFRSYMIAKGGGNIPLEAFFDGPRQAGAAVGLVFNFEQITRAPNSLLSHRLIALTPEAQRPAMIDAIYEAYFEKGQDIGDLDVLVAIAEAQALDAETLRTRLLTDEGRDAVLAEAREAQVLGVTGVPFFVINDRLAFSGAQPAATIQRILQQARVMADQGAIS